MLIYRPLMKLVAEAQQLLVHLEAVDEAARVRLLGQNIIMNYIMKSCNTIRCNVT